MAPLIRVTSATVVGVMPVRSPQSRRHPFDPAAFLGDNRIPGVHDGTGEGVAAILGQSVRNLLNGSNPDIDLPRAARFLCDVDVLAARTALGERDLGAVLADLEATATRLAAIDGDGAAELRLLVAALRRSAGILRLAPDQLPEQLLFRLSGPRGPLLSRLVTGAADYKSGPWLRPLTATEDSSQETVAHLRGKACAVCFDPDHRLLVLDDQRWLECLDLDGAEPPLRFRTGEGEPTALACDGAYAAVATREGPIRVVGLGTGRRAPLVPAGRGATLAVAFVRPGRLVSAGTEGRVRIWDLDTGGEVGGFDTGGVSVEALLPLDGNRLLLGTESAGGAGHALQLWNLTTGRLETTFGSHDWPVVALARSAEAGLVVAAANDELTGWRLSDLSCAWRVTRQHVTFHSLACTSDRALAGDSTGALRLFDLRDGREVRRLPPHSGLVPQIAVDPARRRLATVSYDQSVRLWDAAVLDRPALPGHQQRVRALTLTPDGSRLLSGGADGRVLLRDARTGGIRADLGSHEHWVSAVAALPHQRAVSAGWDGAIRFWDLSRSRCTAVLKSGDAHLTHLACGADGGLAVTASTDGALRVWDLADSEQRGMTTVPDDAVAAVALDGDRVRWMTESGRLWSWRAGAEPVCAGAPLDGRVTACDLGPPGSDAVAGLADGRLVTVAADGAVETVAVAECGPTAIARCASAAGELLLAVFGVPHVASDNTVRLWAGRERGSVAVLVGDSPWTAALIADDGRRLCLGDDSGGVHIVEPVLPGLTARPGPGRAGR